MPTSRPADSTESAFVSAERFVTSSDVFTPTPIDRPPPDVETPMPKPDFFVSLDEARSSAPGVTFTSRAAESSRSRPAETSEPRMAVRRDRQEGSR